MFEDQDKKINAAGPVEDIFEDEPQRHSNLGPPTALSGGKLQPVSLKSRLPEGNDQLSGFAANSSSHISSGRKLLIIIVAAVLVGGGSLGYFWWSSGSGSQGSSKPERQESPSEGAQEEAKNPVSQTLENLQQAGQEQALDPFSQKSGAADSGENQNQDEDQDGLTDGQERQYGTNPSLFDSDADGLSDREEVVVFGTDPLNLDSDADGFPDGAEIQNGYNPKGPGKLLDLGEDN